ncbi:hypothetical protein EDC94DRAFT_657783 [Helicostylum pulchrum]|nr:hypothetical protein EDC94DRAFT_657783 [Helicostylum pulchrum]
MLEICTIALPKDFTEIRSYVANMEDLLPVLHYHTKCTDTSNKDAIKNNTRKMMDSSTLKIIADYGKGRKSPCTMIKCNRFYLTFTILHGDLALEIGMAQLLLLSAREDISMYEKNLLNGITSMIDFLPKKQVGTTKLGAPILIHYSTQCSPNL